MDLKRILMLNWRKPTIFALLYLTGNRIPRYLREIERVSQFSDEAKQAYQDAKLAKLLLHAHANVPYYTKVLFEAGVVRNGVVNLSRFDRIPILTKTIIRREGANLYSQDYRRRKPYENASSGSTGEPIRVMQDREYDEWNKATKLYWKRLGGQDIGERELRLWGSEQDLGAGFTSRREKVKKCVMNWLYNRRERSSYKSSEEITRGHVAVWNRFKPTWVDAFIWPHVELVRLLRKMGLRLVAPRGAVSTAGNLSPEVKQVLEDAYACPVYNRYGSRDFGSIAFGQDSLDVCYWCSKVEVLGDGDDSVTKGRFVVTGLRNFSMPLIRYEIGDVGTLGKSPFTLGTVDTRTTTYFKKKNGEKILMAFNMILYFQDWCRKIQYIQKEYDHILVKVVGEYNKEGMGKVEQALKHLMGIECMVTFTLVDDISSTQSGKYLVAITEVE